MLVSTRHPQEKEPDREELCGLELTEVVVAVRTVYYSGEKPQLTSKESSLPECKEHILKDESMGDNCSPWLPMNIPATANKQTFLLGYHRTC